MFINEDKCFFMIPTNIIRYSVTIVEKPIMVEPLESLPNNGGDFFEIIYFFHVLLVFFKISYNEKCNKQRKETCKCS